MVGSGPAPHGPSSGPSGTFTEQAALELRDRLTRDGESVDLSPASSVPAALDAVRSGSAVAACVPLENSIEGAVPLTHDELTHGTPLVICAEAYVPVTFQLLARPGTVMAGVRSVGSHPHGLAQVRDYFDRELPDVRIVVTDSTAAAARPSPMAPWTPPRPPRSRVGTTDSTSSPTTSVSSGTRSPGSSCSGRRRRRRRPPATIEPR